MPLRAQSYVLMCRLALALWVLCGCCVGGAQAEMRSATIAPQHIESAQFQGIGPPQMVVLPHQLPEGAFDSQGSLVTFTLQVDLAEAPTQAVGVYVAKMALSGQLRINGHVQGWCERGTLQDLRCLHRPYLFETPPVYWKAGRNELQFDIYATARQTNGLSSVWVGDVGELARQFYLWRYWLQVELMRGLTWLSVVVGLLALGAGLLVRQERVYVWFGLTSLANGLANGGIFASTVVGHADWFNWFVFSSRLASVSLGLMMFAAFFDKLTPRLRHVGLLYTAVCLVGVGATLSNRALVSVLYIPLLFAGAGLLLGVLRWSWQARHPPYWVASTLLGLIFAAGIHDWLKLNGHASFEVLYLMGFTYSGVLFLMGTLLLGMLAKGLVQSRALSAELEDRVIARTRELQATHERLMAIELAHVQTLERERLLRDVHDGFGSQLVTAEILVRQQKLSQDAMAQLLQECIADLHLVISTLGNHADSLQDALADLSHRTQQRLMGMPLQLHWHLQLTPPPTLAKDQVLNLLRIVQEALNNVIKHANADTVEVSAVYTPATGVLILRVTDDGQGLDPQSEKGVGQGLRVMSQRAQDMGATLTVTGAQPGTCVELQMQLPLG